MSGLRRAVAATAAQAGVRALLGFRGQRSENREPQNIEYRMLNIEGKKTSSFEIPCSIFDIQNRENCWATGFLLLAEPEPSSKEQVSSDQ